MTAAPVLNSAADVICGSSLVACDGSLLSIAGSGIGPTLPVVQRSTKPALRQVNRKPKIARVP